jgi:hypothetical protein
MTKFADDLKRATIIRRRVLRYPLPGENPWFVESEFDKEIRAAFAGDSGCGSQERGCGERTEGGTYACVPTGVNGQPIEHFILCQPLRIDADEYGLTALGTKLVDVPETCPDCGGTGVDIFDPAQDCLGCKGETMILTTHVFDIIGRAHYPNIADFIEEGRRLGISRRLELSEGVEVVCDICNGGGALAPNAGVTCSKCKGAGTLPPVNQYARLNSRSRLFLLHERAIINNPGDYWKEMGAGEARALVEAGGCPKERPEHALSPDLGMEEILRLIEAPAPGCSALYWHDLDPETIRPAQELCNNCGDILGGYSPETCPDCSQPDALVSLRRFSGREMPSFNYGGFERAAEISPLYSLGVFAIFPLARLEVVDPSGGDEYSAAIERANAAKLPVKITDM